MMAVADNLSAMLIIVQCVVSIISLTLSLILLVKLRKFIYKVTGMPSAAVTSVRKRTAGAWESINGWRNRWLPW